MTDFAQREAKRKEEEREQLRERFRKSLAYRENREDVEHLLQDWEEVDEESATLVEDLD